MNPIRDNDLILYHYRDGLDAGRIAHIEAALHVEPELRERYARLQRTLGAVDAAPDIDVDADFTARLWRRLEQRIESAAPARGHGTWRERVRDLLRSLLSPRFAMAATCMLAIAVGIGYYAGRSSALREPPRDGAMAARVLDAYVAEHLRATEGLLLTAANSDSANLRSGNAGLAATLVDSNRLYAAAAARSGNTRLADFLRQLEPVLIELANQPADASVESVEGLRDYLRKTDLLFQVRATQARMEPQGRHKT